MYRLNEGLELFLVHPGGPFFRNKDKGAWTIPKGLVEEGENKLEAACREFREETGIEPEEPYFDLGFVRQKGGKTVYAWSFRGDIADSYRPDSNTFEIAWPPGSVVKKKFPEVDRAAFFTLDEAKGKINQAQTLFIDRLKENLHI